MYEYLLALGVSAHTYPIHLIEIESVPTNNNSLILKASESSVSFPSQ